MHASARGAAPEAGALDQGPFLERLLDATNAHDVAAIADCFHADFVNETPAHPARGFTGRAQVARNWHQILAHVPDLVITATRHVVAHDTVWAELDMRGTRRDGAPHRMAGVVIFTVREGRAARARFYLEPVTEADERIDAAVRRAVGASPEGAT